MVGGTISGGILRFFLISRQTFISAGGGARERGIRRCSLIGVALKGSHALVAKGAIVFGVGYLLSMITILQESMSMNLI